MEQNIDGFDPVTNTFYVAASLDASGGDGKSPSLIVFVPQAARMVSLDIRADAGSEFSVYVTNSNYNDAAAEAEDVTWYPTQQVGMTESVFTTKSACCGAYKVVFNLGSGMVKARAK